MNDYINRQQVLVLAKDIVLPTGLGYKYRCRAIDPHDVAELPAADVRPVVRGKWKHENEFTLLCSQCGAYLWNNINVISNYCPQCGADMREES